MSSSDKDIRHQTWGFLAANDNKKGASKAPASVAAADHGSTDSDQQPRTAVDRAAEGILGNNATKPPEEDLTGKRKRKVGSEEAGK